MTDWTNIAVFGKLMDFLMVKSLLESFEIEYIVENENAYYQNSFRSLGNFQEDAAYLYVRQLDFEKAKSVFVEYGYQEYLRN